MKAVSALSTNHDWEKSLATVLSQAKTEFGGAPADLALLFISSTFAENFQNIVSRVREETSAKLLAGCSGWGIIGQGREVEAQSAISLMLLSLPDSTLTPFHFTQEAVEEADDALYWHNETGVAHDAANFWMLFADPFTMDTDTLVTQLNDAYPQRPIVGGMASGDFSSRQTHLFLDDKVLDHGGVGIAVGGATTLRTVVAQGCLPIGDPHIITKVERNVILGLSSKPAYQVLGETFQQLTPEVQERAQRNLFVGLVVNEYQEDYKRGDFLIRNIMGVDPNMGALAVGALPRVGQTMQFQLRDPESADQDLRELLESEVKTEPTSGRPIAGLLCCCNGRGKGLFGAANHDAGLVAEKLGAMPLTGFFCNGEIGPVGPKNYLHGYTASLALLVPKTDVEPLKG